MKSKCSFILKSSIALILTALMIFGSVSTVLAATVDMAATGGWEWDVTWKMGSNVSGGWDSSGQSASHTTGSRYVTYDFYFTHSDTHSDGEVRFAFYQDGSWDSRVTPTSNATSIDGSSNKKNCQYGNSGGRGDWYWVYKPEWLSDDGKYYRVTMNLDMQDNNYDGKMWYTATALTSFSPTLTVPSTGTVGTAITLTGGATETGKVGTLTKTYQYSTDNGSTWKDLTSGSYTASSAGTVKFRYKVADGGITSSKAYALSDRIEYSDVKSCTFAAAPVTYNNIAVAAKGSTDGSAYNTTLSGATISANSYTTGSSALNISAGTVSGYSFYKWVVTSGSGTISNANTASTSFVPSASNTTVTARYKKSYTITKNTPTGGSVTLSKDSAVAGDSYTVTLTPNDGYKVKSLTLNGSAVTVSNNKYTGTASGTSDTLAFVATFEPNTSMKLYIAGRFRVRPSEGSSSWTTTYASGSDWNATSTNIPFTYLSGTTYKVDTYATLAELSAKIGSSTYTGDPVFFVYDTTNSKNWYASSTTTMSTSGTTLVTSGGANSNLKFSSTSTDGPVTIYYDSNTHKIWYTIPDLYNVTINPATGGTVTASPARAEADTEITLTIAPTTGYQLKSITAKDSSNASVTLSGTGNTRTFTMPAKNVTVTPEFEKITWSGLTAVGKYSTTAENDASYSNDFPSGSAPNITIAATSATQLDGVAVSAPDPDPKGYVFAGWYTTTGSFDNDANKDTIFYPNAANAVAIAKYKKIFKIESSVDNTGTGAGTVTTDKTSVEAGGSYTITATAKSGSAIESVKVNGTTKTATASQTISGVSADQDVKVKFKSNVYLKGTMNSTAWAGDVMTANSDGTSYTIANVELNADTTYEFRLYADNAWKENSVTTWTLNNIATHSTKSDGYGGTNLTITPSVKAKVTFVSDGTKFTSITAIPYDSTTYNVTLTQSADYTITSTYMGVEYTTSGENADVTVPVYSGTGFSYTVTPASGKYLSGVAQSNSVALNPAFSATTHANSYTGTVSSVSAAFAVSATAASKLSIKAVTNKSARGTVLIDKTTAAPGETINITVTPLAGSLKSLTATYANGTVYTCNLTNKTWSCTTAAPKTAGASTGALSSIFVNPFSKADLAATGAEAEAVSTAATRELYPTGAASTIPMTLAEASAVTINATFDNYSGESTWYYNGYDTSGNALSGYHSKQMTEGMISGEKFSYYHVEGRTGTDQLMTVSNGVPSSGTRYVYFVRPNNYGDGWSASNNPKAHFWKNGGQDYDTWPGTEMSWQWNNDYGQGVYKIAIPDGADRVSFNDATNNGQHQTLDIDLTTTSGAYYVGEWNSTYSKYDYGTWDTGRADQGWVASGTEYFYQNSTHNGDYTGDFNTKGFHNHNTASKEFAKPKDLGTNTGDYYINVLYPNTTYTINGVDKMTGSNPMIIWSAEPLAGDDENVKIYAKDGAIRAETFGSTYANIADTKIYAADGTTTVGTKQNGSIANQTYETYKAAKGDTLVIKTTIGATDSSALSNAADLKAKYYVRGFCINGEVPALLEPTNDGVYTLTYKVPEDFEGKSIEITPIYYLKDTTANPIVTYRVTGFTDELKAVGTGKPGWGDTLYTYPFYGKLGGQNNAFGAYPGQPMVYYKGQYQMQIPVKSTAWDPYEASASTVNNTTVSGVTMSNGYWDSVHKSIMGYGDNSTSADHVQTYDYGDFYKIFNEKAPVDNIVFDFKYETKKHNFENQPAATITKSELDTNYGTNGNGFELLTNFHGRNVDLFGNPLSGAAADPTQTTPVYVVSIGGVNGSAGVENIAGYYATEWMVYGSSDGSSYSRISAGGKNSIPPEVLVLNNDDTTSFNTTTYPSADENHNVTDWKAMYTALKQYAGHPVMISYEAADAQQGQGMYYTGTGGATRNDGRWLYSKNGENITSTIRIDVSHDSGATYVENPASGETGHIDGLSAYFTNADAYQKMTYSTTIDPDKTYDFEAKTTNASYKFVGWYMEDGTKITSDNVSHTERSGSYTFVARFMEVSSGQLTLSHSVDTGEIVRVDGHDYTCNGSGSAKIGAVITDADTDEVLRTFDLSSSDITIPERFIGNDKNYNITVTLEATADTNTAYGTSKLANTDASSVTEDRFFNPKTPTTSGKTTTYTFTFNVKDDLYNGTNQRALALTYHSYFIQYKFNYQINYTFDDRNGETQQYKRIGTLTPGEANTYVKKVDSSRYLDKSFIEKMAPYESNFGQNITWNFEDYLISTGGEDGSNYEYAINAHYTATQTNLNKRNITFVLPYTHNNGVAVMTTDGIGTKDTTTNLELIAVTDEDGKITQDNRVDFNTIPVLPNGGENGIFTENGKKNWIAAPATITDGGSILNFQYWSVKPTDRAGENDPDVARCYFQGFNFVAYDNYIITPVYGESTVEPSEIGRNTNITYVETTRNQWNSNGTNYTKAQTSSAADLLYNDFIVAYNFDGKDIYNGDANADIAELGVVVERIQKLEIKDDGTYDTTLSRYTGIAPDENGVNAAIASTTDIALSGKNKISKHAIAASELDNKNRIQFFNGIYNSSGWVQNDEGGVPAQDYGYKNYVYRAYSYMKLKNGTVIKSAVPAYFTMYDVATADAIDM